VNANIFFADIIKGFSQLISIEIIS